MRCNIQKGTVNEICKHHFESGCKEREQPPFISFLLMVWRKRLTEGRSKICGVSLDCLFVAVLCLICPMKINAPWHWNWAEIKDLHSRRRRRRMAVIQMEIVSQDRIHLTRCRPLKCGCVQERHFKGATPLIWKSAPETVDGSYLENTSFSILRIKRVPVEYVGLYCRCLTLLGMNIDPI